MKCWTFGWSRVHTLCTCKLSLSGKPSGTFRAILKPMMGHFPPPPSPKKRQTGKHCYINSIWSQKSISLARKLGNWVVLVEQNTAERKKWKFSFVVTRKQFSQGNVVKLREKFSATTFPCLRMRFEDIEQFLITTFQAHLTCRSLSRCSFVVIVSYRWQKQSRN